MQRWLILLLMGILGAAPRSGDAEPFFTGADISFLPRVEAGGGVFWWAPEWSATAGFGSSWENLALFDEEGHPLPALEAFNETAGD